MSKYNKNPIIQIQNVNDSVIKGWNRIISYLKNEIKNDHIIVFDMYPGVDDRNILSYIQDLNPQVLIDMKDLFKDENTINEQIKYVLTDDRIFGKMYYGDIVDFIDMDKLEKAKKIIKQAKGLVIIFGFGASLLHPGDKLIYLDLSRWEIQKRYRKGMTNCYCSNHHEDTLRKIKRGYFFEWRIADKHKISIFEKINYFLDTHSDDGKLVSGSVIRQGLKQTVNQPFRTVPYFDPGIWGGQWMKEVCDLDRNESNFAWAFDGVPEENSLLLGINDEVIELPCMNLVLYQPKELLGPKVYARFGAEFPIRFDFLDTMGGQNLSLQVHPLTEYIHRQFGMAYTQDESYYILDAKEDAVVYLGLKEGIDSQEMIADLKAAQEQGIPFDDQKYINQFPAKKHDHFLIPAGTIHCSGKNTMVLEISATPYCFTFKLWDWGRLGLDGKPRPIHIDHGAKVIQWDRTTSWVKAQLVNRVEVLNTDERYIEERTGLHELEFIETRRYWVNDFVEIDNHQQFHMLNLIQGTSCIIASLDQNFEPLTVHYAETFIIPANVSGYKIINNTDEQIGLICAYVR
ncbi:class I mannose-6-phosphate isomerase [[Clostridium] spiroforme]|nr:class I mannose-6-phosphate isomerase [Thomasclavelia spiroformis]